MPINSYADTLSMPLPEDILKRKWAGDLEGAVKAIDLRLQQELPSMLRQRLLCERERILRLPTQYPWNRDQALAKLQEILPRVTSQDLDKWEMDGKVDFIYIGGEKRYFVRFHRTLAKYPQLSGQPSPCSPWLDPMIQTIREKGFLRRRITLQTAVYCGQEDFVPGEYLVHLPFPAECAQQSQVQLLEGDPDGVNPPDAPARAAWWHRQVDTWRKFQLTYSYVSCIRYADPLHAPAPGEPLYPQAMPPCQEDLGESGAFIRFTPYLRNLAAELSADARTPLEKAWKFYEFITTKVKYSFMRDYFQIDHLGEYCAVNLQGDCGLQALLFILLCRIAGIPARWQSGLSIDGDFSAGSHDWAQFYLEGWGWLFCDPSYGGGAYRSGNAQRHAFYFGNIDPMRMVANRSFQAPLLPEKQAFRVDPYDNQSGEMERLNAAPFNGRQLDEDGTLLSYEDMD